MPTLTDQQWQRMPSHPRLFATAVRFEALKTQQDTVSLELLALLHADAEKKLSAPPVAYPSEGFVFWAMRDVQGRILTLSLMYRLTGERRYFERARQDLLELAALPDWGTNHFLDVGEACLAAGVGLDWLHDELSPDDRETLTRAIVNRALLPSLEVPEMPGSWVIGDFNWNQVCHAGLSIGALAIAEREPHLARRIVDRAVTNIPAAGASYAPDGSYPEGPSYWSYGTTFHVLMIEALRGALGTSCGLETLPGFLQTCEFKLQMVAPSGGDFNFSDYHDERQNEPIMLWFARERNRRDLAHAEMKAIAARATVLNTGDTPDKPLNINRHYPLELLWWNPNLPETYEDLPLHWTAGGHLPIAVLRSAWRDPRATYLAIKGGTPDQSHGHMDVGSFILEMNGVRWALDLGTESYDRMRVAKLDLWNYSQESSRWTTYRVGPEGHNILRFGGAYQSVDGKAEIRTLPDDNRSMGNVVELSPLYPAVQSVRRTVRLFPDRSVSIEDAWKANGDAVDYKFQWLTTAEVTVLPQGMRLEQSGEAISLTIDSPQEFQIEVEENALPLNLQDSPNPGLRRLIIRQKTAANASGRMKDRTGQAPWYQKTRLGLRLRALSDKTGNEASFGELHPFRLKITVTPKNISEK